MSDLRFYRPNKDKKGTASSVELRKKEDEWFLFWVGTHQTGEDANGNASFDWKNKENSVTIKLGENDVGELLAALNGAKGHVGQKAEQGLYHKNLKGSSSLQFAKVENGYKVRLASKVGEKLTQVTQVLSLSDAEQLKVLFTLYLYKVFGG